MRSSASIGAAVSSWIAIGLVAASATRAETAPLDVLRWIPAETRVVVQIDPAQMAQQPLARQALSLDAFLQSLPSRSIVGDAAAQITVAYVATAGIVRPVTFSLARGADLNREFTKLRGAQLEVVGSRTLYRTQGSPGLAVAQLDPGCIVEGTAPALHTVLERAGRDGLAGLAEESAGHALLAHLVAASPVTLVYLAPPGGCDLVAAVRDVDRALGAGLVAALLPYEGPLRLLGPTEGLRIDLRQEHNDLATRLCVAMPSRMAAQLASVSLQAGKDMAKLASDAAVRAGSLTAADAHLMEAAIGSMQTRADGELVRVDLRLEDAALQWGVR